VATFVTRNLLSNILKATDISDSAPRIVSATPVGQWHATGTLIVAVTTAKDGWRALYYGPNLPAKEIGAAVKHSRASAVAISNNHLPEQLPLIDEISKLRRHIGREVGLMVRGQAVSSFRLLLEEINAKLIENVKHLIDEVGFISQSNHHSNTAYQYPAPTAGYILVATIHRLDCARHLRVGGFFLVCLNLRKKMISVSDQNRTNPTNARGR
jgi:methylmalonyl-CoA mutase cobalamin-binding subunit